LKISHNFAKSKIEENYHIRVQDLSFLPKGDISYAYVVTSTYGRKYFLKLFDKNTVSGVRSIELLNFYLPITWGIYHKGLCKYVTYPIENIHGRFKVDIGRAVILLFNFIEGKPLKTNTRFRSFLLEKAASGVAQIHKIPNTALALPHFGHLG
jgi:hypothetical protein